MLINLTPNLPLPELTEHEPVEFMYLPDVEHDPQQLQLSLNGLRLEAFLLPGDQHWHWRWNPGAAPGRLHLKLTRLPDVELGEWTLVVLPLKIDQDHYAALIDDIQQLARSLVYSLSAGTLAGIQLVRSNQQRWELIEERAAIFAAPLDRLERATMRILRQPHMQRQPQTEQRLIGEARSIDPSDPDITTQLEPLPSGALHSPLELADGRSMLPQRVREPVSRSSPDSYEHRLLKRVLERLLREARLLQMLLSSEAAPAQDRQLLNANLHIAERRISQLLSADMFASVVELRSFHGPTPLLQRDASYREIFRMWQALRHSPLLLLDEGLLDLPINELPRLYEQWCALQLCVSLLSLGWELIEQHLLRALPEEPDDNQLLQLGLRLNDVMLILRKDDMRLGLRYQPRYRPLRSSQTGIVSRDRHTRIPDLALELEQPGKAPALLIFDAKYRLAVDGQTVPMDALDDAYAYLGALGYADQPVTRAAYILYPGQARAEHYPSGVGALPLLPGEVASLSEVVREFLKAVS